MTKNTEDKTEDEEQIQLIQWCRQDSRFQFLYHIPNESTGGYGWRIRNRKMGCRRGVPDLCFPVPNKKYHGLYIEMKRVSGGSISQYQKRWLDMLNAMGYLAVVCKGWEQARDVLLEYVGE